MATVVLDRIEGDLAVLVLGDQPFELPVTLLPAGASDGDLLTLTLVPDPQATDEARRQLAQRRTALARDDDGGDFSL